MPRASKSATLRMVTFFSFLAASESGTESVATTSVIREGATQVFAACTHAVLSGPAVERLENSLITEVVATDSVPLSEAARNLKKLKILSVADLLARGIRSIHEETSISELFI